MIIYSKFSWFILFTSMIGFVGTYYLWQSDYKNKEGFDWYNVIDLVLELPFEIISYPFKLIYRFIKNVDLSEADADIDSIDIDF